MNAIKRRGFLAMIGAAPVAAQSAVETIGEGIVSSQVGSGLSGAVMPSSDPARDAAFRFLSKLDGREQARRYPPDRYSPHIEGKKSWSPAFKSHVYWTEYEASISAAQIYSMDTAELLALAVKKGWGGMK